SSIHLQCVLNGPPTIPTRRSSDLPAQTEGNTASVPVPQAAGRRASRIYSADILPEPAQGSPQIQLIEGAAQQIFAVEDAVAHPRSEEHTSELQSRENLVCRLLLEK